MTWIARILLAIVLCLSAIFFAMLLAGSTALPATTTYNAARRYTRPVEFDFVNWTLDALGVKLGHRRPRHALLL